MRIGGRRIRVGIFARLIVVFLVIVAAFTCFWGYWALPRFQADKMHDAEDKTRNAVQLACGAIDFVHRMEQAGMMSTGEAQAYALTVVGGLSWDTGFGDGLFWVQDARPVLLMDAENPGLVGADVSGVLDRDGRAVYRDFASIARAEGEGAHRYPMAGRGGGVVTKMSYVKSFAPWGWVVGTRGPDVEALVSQYRSWRDLLGWTLGGICVACLVLFWLAVRLTVSRPLASMVKISEALAEGDVDQQLGAMPNDEVGDLAVAYSRVIDYIKEMAQATSRMAEGDFSTGSQPRSARDVLGQAHSRLAVRQRELIGKTKAAATNVAEASKQLTRASEQTAQATQQMTTTIQSVARGAGEQSASLQQTAQGMEQLTRAIGQIAEGAQVQARGVEEASRLVREVSEAIAQVSANAEAGNESWRATATSATEGARKTHETVDGMVQIKKAMDQVSARVSDLGGRSQEIGKIVATIDDIAAQTNLLALNAAIEAARAGEQGRGFAVVADEVRKLAERASLATREIAILVGGIQTSLQEAVAAMRQGSRDVESGCLLAADAGASLDSILDQAQSVSRQAEQASAAARVLNDFSSRMVAAIDGISKVVQQNAAATAQMTRNSQSVSTAVASSADIAANNSAAAQEVAAATEQMSAQVEETLAAALSLTEMSGGMEQSVAVFKLD